jgi:Membrane domain of glycerophosphoryl diester phosphodiesterase
MRAELRPSSLGEILDRTAQMYRSYFLLYFGIAAISYTGILVLSLLVDVLFYSHTHTNARSFAAFRVVLGIAIALLTILPVAIAMAAVMHAVARNYLGQSCTIREAYVSVGRRWYRYILILLAMDMYAALPLGVFVAAIALSSVLLPPGMTRVIVIGLAVVMMLAGIFVVFWMLLRWTLSIPASVMENLGVHRALKRSSILTKGGIGRIFVMLLLVVAVTVVIQYAIQIPMFFLLWKSRGVLTLSTQIAASLGGSFSGAFVLPIYSIALTLFYYDQRIRKEGYDVEWLMEQAAVTHGTVPLEEISSDPAAPGSLTAQTEPPGPAI